VQGRLDLNVYVLNSLHHVDVMLVPHALSCASHAVSEVEFKGGRAKLRVNAERRFFSVVKHGLHQCFAGGRRGRKTCPHVNASHTSMCATKLVRACTHTDMHVVFFLGTYICIYICICMRVSRSVFVEHEGDGSPQVS
jgi:hypothetical protein